MKYTCVTSMNEQIYQNIGKYMIESWIQHWSSDCKLKVYAENFVLPVKHKNIEIISWEDTCLENWKIFDKNSNDGRSKRFAKKGFSFSHAMNNNDTDYIIWLDSDILSHKKVTDYELSKILPENKLIGFFDTFYQLVKDYTLDQYLDIHLRKTVRPDGGSAFAAESGFVIINTNHKFYNQYKDNYRKLFLSSIKHECLDRWYDGEVCVVAAKDFLNEVEDLSKLRITNKTQTPLNRCWLSEYFTHQKGRVKDTMDDKGFELLLKNKEKENKK